MVRPSRPAASELPLSRMASEARDGGKGEIDVSRG